MKNQDEGNQMAATHPWVELTAMCRRFLSTVEVLNDTTYSRLIVGNPDEVMELRKDDADDVDSICHKLLYCLFVAKKQLGGESEALDEYETPRDHLWQDTEGRTTEWIHHRLSLVRDAARDMADHIRSIWHIPPNWVAEQGLDRNEKRLEFVLVSLEWARRDILKQLAQLVVIFDEYDDSDSTPPWEAWLSPDVRLSAEIDDE
jgi:hypothetical protein